MKKLLFRYGILFTIILFLAVANNLAAKETFTKTVKKEFQVSKNALLSVHNKYGKIHCNNWDKDMVSIEVTIAVETSNEQKASKIFDRINIEMSGTSSHVKAETIFSKGFTTDNEDIELDIDYLIYMPETLSVELGNKFGDIFLDQILGEAEIFLAYGNMEANKLANSSNNLEIKYSNVEVGYIESGDIEVKYSNFYLEETQNMNIESKFSTMTIETIIETEIESEYDSYDIGGVVILTAEMKFSGWKISKLKRRADINSEYGGIKIKYVPAGFEEINIENSYGDIGIGIDEEASYSVDAVMKYGSLDYPEDNANIKHQVEGYTTNIYQGTIGDDPNPVSQITIESKNAGATIKAW